MALKRAILLTLISSAFTAACPAQAEQVLLNLDSAVKSEPGKDAVRWKVQPRQELGEDFAPIFAPGYDVTKWVPARVPGTVFGSYVDAGLEEDPNFGDNIYRVDKPKYERDFWYRTEFKTPTKKNSKLWLNFEGINRKGDVYLNGTHMGHLDGFMQRGRFDVTDLVRQGQSNVLGVLVQCPKLPIPNLAMPTYMSSASWDWMPHVPGLLAGITDDVFLSTSGQLTLVDPWIRTDVPSLDRAEVSLSTELKNHTTAVQQATLSGLIQPGNIRFSQRVEVGAGQTRTVRFDANSFRQLLIRDPKLWWPNGYGQPNLYRCDLRLEVDGQLSDSKSIRFGIKKYSYDTDGDVLHLRINGKPVFLKGGNWGMSEYMLRCRGDEYDLKVRLHKEMNFNMIRNWIGSTTDEEFYEACDKYGILVWDDFWLNSHANLPTDLDGFNRNAIEKIKRLRNHPSIAIWCGDNEGTPLPPLNDWLRQNVARYDGNDRRYQPCSNSGSLSGSGPWTNMESAWYFTKYPRSFSPKPSWGLRSEIGTAVFTNFESFKKFMPRDKWWPRNEMWDKHFFGPSAANASPDKYEQTVNTSYGPSTGIEEFCRKAQLLNIETNKAMFEGWQHNMWDDASGVLTWMSQSAYPSLVWQTYDYYYDLNGAYWGVKKACEPVHIQWSSGDNSVKVINTTGTDLKNLRAEARVFNLDGSEAVSLRSSKTLSVAPSNAASPVMEINFNRDNLAHKAKVTASTYEDEDKNPLNAVDGGLGSRWSSQYNDDQWLTVDLGSAQNFSQVKLVWETAYGKAYKIQVSSDGVGWHDVFSTEAGDGGSDVIDFAPVRARFVRMLGIKRGTDYGYSLHEFEVYADSNRPKAFSDVHFIDLKLKDKNGRLLSENFYWNSVYKGNYTAFNSLPKARLDMTSSLTRRKGKCFVKTTIHNPPTAPVALAVRVVPVRASTGEQLLPVIMNDNYFTLMPGQSRKVEMEFDTALLGGDGFEVRVEPYNRAIRDLDSI